MRTRLTFAQFSCCREFFDWVTGGDDYLYDFLIWRHDRIHTQALSKEWTGENGDVKRVLVKFSTLTNWNTGVARSAW